MCCAEHGTNIPCKALCERVVNTLNMRTVLIESNKFSATEMLQDLPKQNLVLLKSIFRSYSGLVLLFI